MSSPWHPVEYRKGFQITPIRVKDLDAVDVADINMALVVHRDRVHRLEGARTLTIPAEFVLVFSIAVIDECHVIEAAQQVNIAHAIHRDRGIQLAVIGHITDRVIQVQVHLAIFIKTDNIFLVIEQYTQDAAICSRGDILEIPLLRVGQFTKPFSGQPFEGIDGVDGCDVNLAIQCDCHSLNIHFVAIVMVAREPLVEIGAFIVKDLDQIGFDVADIDIPFGIESDIACIAEQSRSSTLTSKSEDR